MYAGIQSASLSRFEKKEQYFIHSYSQVKMGASVAAPPFLWLDFSTPLVVVTSQLLYVLSCSKSGLPNPEDWKKTENEFLQAAGLQKPKDLYEHARSISVHRKGDTLSILPLLNHGRKGFTGADSGYIEVSINESPLTISLAVQEALDKSQICYR